MNMDRISRSLWKINPEIMKKLSLADVDLRTFSSENRIKSMFEWNNATDKRLEGHQSLAMYASINPVKNSIPMILTLLQDINFTNLHWLLWGRQAYHLLSAYQDYMLQHLVS